LRHEYYPLVDLPSFLRSLEVVASTDDWPDGLSMQDLVGDCRTIGDLELAAGERVLLRADLDVPVRDGKVIDDSRIRASEPAVRECMAAGANPILFGHIGRDPGASLVDVAAAWEERLKVPVRFIDDWWDDERSVVRDTALDLLFQASPGDVFMLENCRKYSFETAAWGLPIEQIGSAAEPLHAVAVAMRSIAKKIVIECIAASNFDFSSSILPLSMDDVALGEFLRSELLERVTNALAAEFLIMSGLKANKLDDLSLILENRPLKYVAVGGALSISLLAAQAAIEGRHFEGGRVMVDETNAAYVSPERIDQARHILLTARARGVEFVLPVDFMVEDGRIVRSLDPSDVQFDVGPVTILNIEAAIERYLEEGGRTSRLFVNGSVGMYERPEYEAGSRAIVELCQDFGSRGLEVYVGGGDGRAAFERFGDLDRVTYAFTSGGTILKLMAGKSIAFLNAAYLSSKNRE
jgi:phosphoglycerate kinase